jgi:hypothetical protein
VGRFVSAIAFLVLLVAVLGAAGCGQRFERGPGDAPAPADLAADALAAVEAEGSAHFVADVRSTAPSPAEPLEFGLHVEGDVSATVLDAEGSVDFGGGTLRGRVLVGEHDFYLQFMGEWYGEHGDGIAEALEDARSEHDGDIWDDLATAEGLRRNFDRLFEGEVTNGPELDGVSTWQFEGRLNADGLVDFARRYGAQPTDREEEMLAKLADASRFVLVVGQEDKLPRRLEFSVELSPDDLKEMEESDSEPFDGASNFKATLELSEFGKKVEFDPPADFRPLDQFFGQLFSRLE